MKKILVIGLALAAFASGAFAQRVPDSSVTGTARATIGIKPAPPIPLADYSLQSAYDPSWTALIGAPTQTLLPRKLTVGGVQITFVEGGNVQVEVTEAVYPCTFVGVAYIYYKSLAVASYNKERCTFSGYQKRTFTGPAAAGRGSFRYVFQHEIYQGAQYETLGYMDEFAGPVSRLPRKYQSYQINMSPIITSAGALTGYSFQINDDDYFYGTYNNPTLTTFTGSGSGPYYFCDPQNSCGGYWGQFQVSN